MLRLTLVSIIRFFRKNILYALSLLMGFTLSIATATLIFSFIDYESKTDSQHPDPERIFRVLMDDPVTKEKGLFTFPYLPERLVQMHEVRNATHIYYPGRIHLRINDRLVAEDAAIYCDTAFADVFSFSLVHGDARSLIQPFTAFVTPDFAVRHFKQNDIMGAEFKINDNTYRVAGIIDATENSHLHYSLILSKASLPPPSFVFDYAGLTYVKLADADDQESFEVQAERRQKDLLPMPDEATVKRPFQLQKLRDIYFDAQYSNDFLSPIIRSRDQSFINFFWLAGAGIFLLSLFNYVIFSGAKSMLQIREVAIKSIFGAPFSWLVLQKAMEAIIILCASSILALLLVWSLLPEVGTVLDSTIRSDFVWNSAVIINVAMLEVVVAVFLGVISASILWLNKNFSLRENLKVRSRAPRTLRAFVVAQLVVCAMLVCFSGIILSQLHFIRTQPVGFATENVVEIRLAELPQGLNPQTLKTEILKLPNVISASVADGSPITTRWTSTITINNTDLKISSFAGDIDFVSTYGFTLLRGRVFSNEIPTDTATVLVNEVAEKLFQLDGSLQSTIPGFKMPYNVIGVVRNFHFNSFHDNVGPAVLGLRSFKKVNEGEGTLGVHLYGDAKAFITYAENLWKKSVANAPFEFSFVQEKYLRLYREEFNLATLLICATIAILFISLFGLLAVSSLEARHSMHEVAIRKTLGATSVSILRTSVARLMAAIVVAAVIGIPLGLYVGEKWLENFIYKISFEWWIPASTVLGLIVFCLLVTGAQIYKSAMTNPSLVLRKNY